MQHRRNIERNENLQPNHCLKSGCEYECVVHAYGECVCLCIETEESEKAEEVREKNLKKPD